MEDILLNQKPLKNVILQRQNKKTGQKEKIQVDLPRQFNAWLDLWQFFIFII